MRHYLCINAIIIIIIVVINNEVPFPYKAEIHFVDIDIIYTPCLKKSSTSYFAEYFRAGLTDCKNFNGYRVRDNQ